MNQEAPTLIYSALITSKYLALLIITHTHIYTILFIIEVPRGRSNTNQRTSRLMFVQFGGLHFKGNAVA